MGSILIKPIPKGYRVYYLDKKDNTYRHLEEGKTKDDIIIALAKRLIKINELTKL